MSERFDKFKKFVKKYFWDVVVFIILMVMNRATPLRGLAVFAMIESACYLLKFLCIKFLYREGFNDEEIDDITEGINDWAGSTLPSGGSPSASCPAPSCAAWLLHRVLPAFPEYAAPCRLWQG